MNPFGSALLVRSLLVGTAIVVLTLANPIAGLATAVCGAIYLWRDTQTRLAPFRRNLMRLAAEAGEDPPRPAASLQELAFLLSEARERLAEERRKAETERDGLLALLEASKEGILVLGQSHRIELVNDAARLFLDPLVDPLGRSLHEVTRSRELIEFAEALRHGEYPEPRRVRLAGHSGARWIHLSGAWVRGQHVQRRVVLVLHDMTDLQHLEKVRTDFVANVSHEMRSPLASILGYAETLADEPGLTGEATPMLERITRNARRLDDIVRDLIELSRLEHATAPEVRMTDVAALLQDVLVRFDDAAAQKSLGLLADVGGLRGEMQVDPGLLRQAIANLVDNAVKYTPQGGTVRVTGARRMRGEGSELVLTVADTGPGIPEEHRDRIFERFYRVDTARSRALGGTGLGLAIVKHAMALQQGTVEIESQLDQGTTFTLHVPLPEPTPSLERP